MCRHCSGITDPDERRLMHEFMDVTAQKMSEGAGVELEADDIEIAGRISNQTKAIQALLSSPEIPGLLVVLASHHGAIGGEGDDFDLRAIRRGQK